MNRLTFEEYRWLWDLVSRKPFLTLFPLHLDVELTSHCNLRCRMCFQQHMESKRSHMNLEVFQKIIDEGSREGLCGLKLQSRGESLLHPQIMECLAYAKQKNILDIHLTTNGLLLTDDIISGLVDNGLNLLILSFDFEHAAAAKMTQDEYIKYFHGSYIKNM